MVEYNPFSEEVMRDPYPVYQRLRAEAPVYYIEKYDTWVLSKFEDIWNASMDAESFTTELGTTSSHLMTKVQPVTPMLNMMDPPRHTQLRARIRKYFMPAAMNKLEPAVRALATECIDSFAAEGRCDVVNDFAAKISVAVACIVNGFPLSDSEMLYGLVQRFFARDPEIDGMTPDGLKAFEELYGYFAQLVQDRRASGKTYDDVIDVLMGLEEDGAPLPVEALGSHLSMFLIGGAETFPKVYANAIRWLAEFPDERAKLVRDKSLAPDALNEALRYDMPTQFLCRVVKNETQVRGQKLRKGQVVMFVYPSANRDADEFESPDTFRIERRPPRILSFGHGVHSCIGIHAAKMEGRVCLEAMAERFPDYAVDLGAAERIRTEFVQGFLSLPITF